MGTKSNSAGQKNEKPFSYICELHATGNSLQTESTKLDAFFNRRLTQTFLPTDPAGKKHVNRCAIILFDCRYNFVALSNPLMTRYYLFGKKYCLRMSAYVSRLI
jgi:hypothetical protein